MRIYFLILSGIFYAGSLCSQHKIINQLKDFSANSNLVWYEQKIQQDLNKYDEWLKNSYKNLTSHTYKPADIDLQKENKIFALAVALANTENYDFKDDIYDYLIIDSLRTFIIVCVDDKMNVTGITDLEEPGGFHRLDDLFFCSRTKERRNRIRKIIKNINKEKPDLILYCENWLGAFLYIKNEKIYIYNLKTRSGREFNEYVRESPNVNFIQRSNEMLWPYSKEKERKGSIYRLTGHTPLHEVRLCPPLN